jgi:hypothetical protein
MIDLSALDNEFAGMTRGDILRALLEAAGDGYATFAGEPDDNRGRLAAEFEEGGGDASNS